MDVKLSERKGLKAYVKLNAMCEISPIQDPVTYANADIVGEVIIAIKEQMVRKIQEQAKVLTIHDLFYEEITLPN